MRTFAGPAFFSLLLLTAVSVGAADSPRVEQFSPQGTVKGIRQVRAQFSDSMVPFGDPSKLIEPFAIACPEKGTARWVDGKNWVFEFARDLPAGIRCEFSLKPDVETLAGQAVAGQPRYAFSTGGPAVTGSDPYEDSSAVDEAQMFILTLDEAATPDSILAHVSFSVEGLQGRVGVRIVTGRDRARILKTRYRKTPPSPVVVLQARQRFPNDAKVSLVWGKGVASKSGVATEQEQVLHFKTRRPFRAEFRCERENAKAGCLPITPMSLQFTAPVAWDQAKAIVLKGPQGAAWQAETDSQESPQDVMAVQFKPPFPEQMSFTIEVPSGLKDDAGRVLANADQFPLTVRTHTYPPLAKFPAPFGIIEWKADPALPVTLRNIESQVKTRLLKIGKKAALSTKSPALTGKVRGKVVKVPAKKGQDVLYWLDLVTRRHEEWARPGHRETSVFGDGKKALKTNEFAVPKPGGAKPFEVVGIPLPEPGLYVVEIESEILGQALLDNPRPMYVSTLALVTNLAVHFKWGRESSLAWVTTLDQAQPVTGAAVTVKDCVGKMLWQGRTDAQGIAKMGNLPEPPSFGGCPVSYPYNSGLLITAELGDDLTFVHSGWDKGIESWRFQLPGPSYRGPVLVHSILDRGLFRAGETVHMKHILRRPAMQGFGLIPNKQRPTSVTIQHQGTFKSYELPVKWDASGVAETTWAIPAEAKLGVYGIFLKKQAGKKARGALPNAEAQAEQDGEGFESTQEWPSGKFRVEEFRVPLMKGTIQPPAQPLLAATQATLDVAVQYLAGGGAGQLPVIFRSRVQPRSLPAMEGFEEFTFANGPVIEGLIRRGGGAGEDIGDSEESEDTGSAVSSDQVIAETGQISRQELKLDQTGGARTTVGTLLPVTRPMDLLTELEFRDPNGEVQTVSAHVPLWPARLMVGVKPDSWALSKEALKFQVAVIDLAGKPVAGTPVTVDLFTRKTYSHRTRLVGGFYAYEHLEETTRLGALCEGQTDGSGLLHCEAKSPVSGSVILQAVAKDDEGHVTVAHQEAWVAGKEEWWFEVTDHDRMDLLPTRKRYEPGETAVFQVRMPFREATALVAVEREGVLETFVTALSGKAPVVEVPIKGHYAPNVFVSVLAVRGRVGDVQPTALVDLGRPAYKLGIAELKVGWKEHELKVSVSSDRPVYKVREKARVQIAVKTFDGQAPPPGSEVAVAAVDEGLLELLPNQSWKLLDAMMGRRGYEVHTATAQMHVVGKRHFGLKAQPQGGGGGRQPTRELFDTLLLWRGRVPLDARGEASLDIPLNDSITSFRIVVVATGGTKLFGTGATSIRSSQDLMLFSGVAPLVREGDRIRSEFTLRNATDRSLDITLTLRVKELPEVPAPKPVSLGPGEAKALGWDLTVPVGTERLTYQIEAADPAGRKDSLTVTQRVVPAVPVRTIQATLTQVEKEFRIPLERPAEAIPGRGGVTLSFRPSLADSLSGVTEYMARYPYRCLEQDVSRAVAQRDRARWTKLMAGLPASLDGNGLAKYFPSMDRGSDVLTSYILAIAHEAAWEIPADVRSQMEAGLKSFIAGTNPGSSPLPAADLSIRKLAAIEALSRTGQAQPEMLTSIAIEPNLWPTSSVLDWKNILQRIAGIPDRDARLTAADQILRARLNLQGTTMGFSTESSDRLWWLMVSADLNAVKLVLSMVNRPEWKEDVPRLIRGALGRQRRGAWDLTVANAWGVLAVEKFAKAFERTAVAGRTTASLAGGTQEVDWTAMPKGAARRFGWPAQPGELTVTHTGAGKPWVTVQSQAAIPRTEPFTSGYVIKKTVTPLKQKQPGIWSLGDLARVRLEVEAQTDMTWVVVSDPIPGGGSILGSGLGRDSQLAMQGDEKRGQDQSRWLRPIFEERSFEAFRAYYEYVPKGSFTVEYTLRVNQGGSYHLPPTRVEAMYAPELFGELPNQSIEVLP